MSLSLGQSSVWAVFELSHGGPQPVEPIVSLPLGVASWRSPDAVIGLTLLLPHLPGPSQQ